MVSFCWKNISETASGIYGSQVMNALRAASWKRDHNRSPELRSGFAVVTGSPKEKWRQLRKTHPNPTGDLVSWSVLFDTKDQGEKSRGFLRPVFL